MINSQNNFMLQINRVQKKKILFVIPSFSGGGAERVVLNIISHLEKNKYEISLVLFNKKGQYLSLLPDYIKIYDLKKRNALSMIKLICSLTKLLREYKPDSVVSFLYYSNIITMISKLLSFRKFKLIVSIRSPFNKEFKSRRFKKLFYFLYKQLLIKYPDCILVNSIASKKQLLQFTKINDNRIKVIYNLFDLKIIEKLKDENLEDLCYDSYVLAVGRLSYEKGFTCLLRAFSLIKEKVNKRLVILGDGPDGIMLKELAINLGIQERVLFLGFQNNPYKFMKNASIFILTSLFEGFPNVLIEAMACGVPVISTDCPTGPNEIIINGVNGILIPPANEGILAEAMLNLLKNEGLRKIFSEIGRKSVERFSVEVLLPQYEKLF